jgi:hypothetical protein
VGKQFSRRDFFASAAAAGVTRALRDVHAAEKPARLTICNPLLRTPLSLSIDDSCPVIHKAYYWIKQRRDWRLRHHLVPFLKSK